MQVVRKITAALTGVLAGTALIAGTASSALAGPTHGIAHVSTAPSRLVFNDGPGDVWRFDPGTEQQTKLAHFPRADVTRAVFRHGAHAVSIRMRFVDIRPVGTQLFWVHIRTKSYQYDAVLSSKPGARRGIRYFQGDDGSRSCPGFTRKIDYRRDLVTMRIPRSCLHQPRWVRLGVFNQLTFKSNGPRYFDTPLNHLSPASHATETRRIYVA